MQFWKRLTKQSISLNFYDSIDDLPIKKWFRIHENEDYTLLLVDKKDIAYDDFIKLKDVWCDIYDQYLRTFGLSEEYTDFLQTRKEIALMKCEMIMDKSKKHLKTMIKIEEEKLKGESKRTKDNAVLSKTIAKISKINGIHLKQNELSVSEYYSYIENIKDGNK